MDYMDTSEPPAKKRRFFTHTGPDSGSDINPSSSATSTTTPKGPQKRFFQVPNRDDTSIKSDPYGADSTPLPMRPPLVEQGVEDTSNRSQDSSSVKFDQETFESFVGDKVTPETLDIIRENCGDNLERAVNMYFDGTWKNSKKSPLIGPFPRSSQSSMESSLEAQARPVEAQPQRARPRRSIPESRYIGAFGVEGWATRSGINLLKHGDGVKIERQKIQPPAPPKTKAKLGVQVAPQRPNTVASRRVDVIVRFTNRNGMEVGRLAKETANWVSTLMDQKICKFEGTCVYAPERLRTNDTVFLQLRCFLLASAFDGRSFTLADDRSVGLFEEKETSEEKNLRLRQVALIRVFQEINLMPTRVNAAAAKHQREGLLEAAEMAEKKEKELPKTSNGASKDDPNSSPGEDPEDGEELEQDQLDALYRKAQSFDFNTPEAEPADTFAMELRPYQKQSLHWMMAKEKDENSNREPSIHPLWEEYAWPTTDADDCDIPQADLQPNFYVNPYSGDLSLEFPAQEQHCLGGILADEMGLGKTIQMLSLIHSHKSPVARHTKRLNLSSVNQLPRLASNSPNILSAPCTTLVVAPMSLLSQWQSETEKASMVGTLKCLVYYGSDKVGNLQAQCCEASAASAPDIVITSYGVVLSEYAQIASRNGDKSNHTGLFSLNFWRVILDEAHFIKNRQAKTAKACYQIAAQHRWVLTGTPIVNKLEDLFSLIRFLGVEPWNNFSFWRTFITVPFESKDFMRALDVVQTVLEPLVMRRTKDMKTPDGELYILPAAHALRTSANNFAGLCHFLLSSLRL
jgi:DNA repair protein RAD5